MKRIALWTAAAVLASGIAHANFTGYYDHANWTLELNDGDGAIETTDSMLILTGANNNYRIFTPYTIKAPGDGVFSFSWDYSCEDEYDRLDTAGYSVGGICYLLAERDGQHGSVSVPVLAGQMIGFWADTSDGMDQPGVLKVTQFEGPAVAGLPTGACCFIQPGCIGGLFEDECYRRGGEYLGDGSTCSGAACGEPAQYLKAELSGGNMLMSTIANARAHGPQIAYNSQDNEFLVVWQEESLAQKCGWAAQRYDTAGNPLGDTYILNLTQGYQINPTVTYNSVDNEYLVQWRWQQSSGSTWNSLQGQRLAADLTELGGVMQLGIQGMGFESAAAYNSTDNEYFSTGRGWTPDPGGVYGTRTSGGTVLDQAILIDGSVGFTNTLAAPNGGVAWNSIDNQYLVTYSVQCLPTWSSFTIRGALVQGDGTLVGNPFELNFTPNFRSFYSAASAAFDANQGRYLVFYGDTRPIPLRGQFVNRDGRLMGFPFEYSDWQEGLDVSPHAAFDPVNNVYFVTWCRNPVEEHTNIYGQLLGADGSVLGPRLTLTTTAFHKPSVAADVNNGGFLVTWRDERNAPSSQDVYGQYVAVTPFCPADLDGDMDVDLSDLAQLLGNYGTTSGATYEMGDLNGDGAIQLSDLAELLARYGSDCN